MDFFGIISSLKNNASKAANSKQALIFMAILCFLEPICVPMIPELVIAPLIITRRSERLKIFIIALTSTILGSVVAYIVSSYIGQFVINSLGDSGSYFYETGLSYLHSYGLFLPLVGSFLPFPLKIITWISGLTHFNPWVLFSGIGIGRSIRYSLIMLIPRGAVSTVSKMRKWSRDKKTLSISGPIKYPSKSNISTKI